MTADQSPQGAAPAAATQPFDATGFLRTTPERPGVYRMYDGDGLLLYVGKAKNLKKRLSSYFRSRKDSINTEALVSRIRSIETLITHSETEALLLEQNLIKAHRPPYNILLRDDKSYPYIYLSGDHEYPRLSFYRGRRGRQPGRYFGPFPGSQAVRETLNLVQKIFKVRQCEDSIFSNRSRPCLQYQIKRCKAPCVGYVSTDEYAEDVQHSCQLLAGQNEQVMRELTQAMEAASAELAFEKAAELRDQIAQVRQIQAQQVVSGDQGEADIVGLASAGDLVAISILFVRGGRMLGSKQFFPKVRLGEGAAELLESVLAQFYLRLADKRDFPREVLIPDFGLDTAALQQALSQTAGWKIGLRARVRGERRGWQRLAQQNAEQALLRRQGESLHQQQRWQRLEAVVGQGPMQRIECFDISHTQGEATVASCVVFGPEGAVKESYRRFNIEAITGGDDYAAMAQALARRYRHLSENMEGAPDLVLIDGGLGQLGAARQALDALDVQGLSLLGVAKGVTRKPGLERLLLPAGGELELEGNDPALLLIQQVRDEAHRFAVTGHRGRRQKARQSSALEDIPGIGAKRRSALLRYFGGLQGVRAAPVQELARVPGISSQLAQTIYDRLHG